MCSSPDCETLAEEACGKIKACGHACGGVRGESQCMPCFSGCDCPMPPPSDPCMCSEALSSAPAVRLDCGHVFHGGCMRQQISVRGQPRLTFGTNVSCAHCRAPISPPTHEAFKDALEPVLTLQAEVRKKALLRVRAEGKEEDPEIAEVGGRFYKDPLAWGMHHLTYYQCFTCKKPYFGGLAECGEARNADWDPKELICSACVPNGSGTTCSKHGDDYISFKCQFCCSASSFLCSG